jgi:hypothetical protein
MRRLIQVLGFWMNKSRIAIKTRRIILLLSPEGHLMFYAPPLEGKAWGADPPKSAVMLNPQFKDAQPIDVFIVPWADGRTDPLLRSYRTISGRSSALVSRFE